MFAVACSNVLVSSKLGDAQIALKNAITDKGFLNISDPTNTKFQKEKIREVYGSILTDLESISKESAGFTPLQKHVFITLLLKDVGLKNTETLSYVVATQLFKSHEVLVVSLNHSKNKDQPYTILVLPEKTIKHLDKLKNIAVSAFFKEFSGQSVFIDTKTNCVSTQSDLKDTESGRCFFGAVESLSVSQVAKFKLNALMIHDVLTKIELYKDKFDVKLCEYAMAIQSILTKPKPSEIVIESSVSAAGSLPEDLVDSEIAITPEENLSQAFDALPNASVPFIKSFAASENIVSEDGNQLQSASVISEGSAPFIELAASATTAESIDSISSEIAPSVTPTLSQPVVGKPWSLWTLLGY